jgi:hypothetical protein
MLPAAQDFEHADRACAIRGLAEDAAFDDNYGIGAKDPGARVSGRNGLGLETRAFFGDCSRTCLAKPSIRRARFVYAAWIREENDPCG